MKELTTTSDPKLAKAERKRAKRTAFEERRKNKNLISPANPDHPRKDISCDKDAGCEIIKIEHPELSSFHCFRCNADKSSKNKYRWCTTKGDKIICNGCNGLLLSMRKNATVVSAAKPTDKNKQRKKARTEKGSTNIAQEK